MVLRFPLSYNQQVISICTRLPIILHRDSTDAVVVKQPVELFGVPHRTDGIVGDVIHPSFPDTLIVI
jgi:hypothetical protein